MDISSILKLIKTDFDVAITTASFNGKTYPNGNKAKEALIRSQRIINHLHEFVKEDFVRCGVDSKVIYPPIGRSGPEKKVQGFLKTKKQDITIVPNISNLDNKKGKSDAYLNERIITVNVRSQLSSLKKNVDTLYERTFAEALNLHLLYPKQCLGEVYLIPTHEYNDRAMFENQVKFKAPTNIEYYIKIFQAINNRVLDQGEEYKYERASLVIADFRQETPVLYTSTAMLKKDGLIPNNTAVILEGLTIEGFTEDIFKRYTERFEHDLIIG